MPSPYTVFEPAAGTVVTLPAGLYAIVGTRGKHTILVRPNDPAATEQTAREALFTERKRRARRSKGTRRDARPESTNGIDAIDWTMLRKSTQSET